MPKAVTPLAVTIDVPGDDSPEQGAASQKASRAPQRPLAVAPLGDGGETMSKGCIESLTPSKVEDILDTSWQMQYALGHTTWDAGFLVGLGVVGARTSAAVVVFGVLAFLAQALFALSVLANMSSSDFDAEFVRDLKFWRVTAGHDLQYFNHQTGWTLARSVCYGSNLVPSGAQQVSLFQHMAAFLPGSADTVLKGGRPFRATLASICGGPTLCMAAVMMWVMTIFKELGNIWHFTQAVWSQQRYVAGGSHVQYQDGRVLVAYVSTSRAVALTLFVSAPRLGIAGMLGYVGVTFLTATTTIEDLVLNTMALEFVLSIPDLLLFAVIPKIVRRIIEEMRPLTIERTRSRGPLNWNASAKRRCNKGLQVFFPALALPVVVGACYWTLLRPTIWYMEEAMSDMCGGDLDFVFLRRPDGLVLTANTTIPEEQRRSLSIARLAVLQRAGLADPEFSGAPRFIELGDVSSLILSAELYPTLGDFARDKACVDFGKTSTRSELSLIMSRLREVTGDSAATNSCNELRRFCAGSGEGPSLVRLYCPETCGCDDPLAGRLFREGCPGHCRAKFDLRLGVLPCEDPGVQALSRSPAWANYTQQVLLVASPLRLGLGDLALAEKLFRERGCGAFLQLQHDFCTPGIRGLHQPWALSSARPFCPTTCGCQLRGGGEDCPGTCAPPLELTDSLSSNVAPGNVPES